MIACSLARGGVTRKDSVGIFKGYKLGLPPLPNMNSIFAIVATNFTRNGLEIR